MEEKENKVAKNEKKNLSDNKENSNASKKTKSDDKTKKKEKKDLSLKAKIIRTVIVIAVIAGLIVLGYYILNWTGVWEHINTAEKLRDVILSWGIWGRLGFIFIQFAQVTFLPLPSTVTVIAGSLVYGPLQGGLLSTAGILLGSIFAFFLGRVFGKKLVVFMVGEKTCDKWTHFLSNAKYSFVIMMLLPIFPDDVLCLVAGLTNMSWTFFTVTNLISRPIGVLSVSYVNSLIPYHGWGLAVWAVIIVAIVVVIVLAYKYQKQIENFILKIFGNKKTKIEGYKKGEKNELSERLGKPSKREEKEVTNELLARKICIQKEEKNLNKEKSQKLSDKNTKKTE